MKHTENQRKNQCETCRFAGHRQKGCVAQAGIPRYLPEEGCPMYAMSAQAFMQQVAAAQRRIISMEERAAFYRDMSMRSTGNMQSICSGGPASGSRVEDGMSAFMDICRDIEEEARQLRECVRQVKAVIERLTDMQEREILELRYLSALPWLDIGDRLHMNERTVRRIHVKALEHVQREMDLAEYAVHRPGWNPGQAQPQAVQ